MSEELTVLDIIEKLDENDNVVSSHLIPTLGLEQQLQQLLNLSDSGSSSLSNETKLEKLQRINKEHFEEEIVPAESTKSKKVTFADDVIEFEGMPVVQEVGEIEIEKSETNPVNKSEKHNDEQSGEIDKEVSEKNTIRQSEQMLEEASKLESLVGVIKDSVKVTAKPKDASESTTKKNKNSVLFKKKNLSSLSRSKTKRGSHIPVPNNSQIYAELLNEEGVSKAKEQSPVESPEKNQSDEDSEEEFVYERMDSSRPYSQPYIPSVEPSSKETVPDFVKDTQFTTVNVDFANLSTMDDMVSAYMIGAYDDEENLANAHPGLPLIEDVKDIEIYNQHVLALESKNQIPKSGKKSEKNSEIEFDELQDAQPLISTSIVERSQDEINSEYDSAHKEDDYNFDSNNLKQEIAETYQRLRQSFVNGYSRKTDLEKEIEPIDANGNPIKFSRFRNAQIDLSIDQLAE